MVNVKAFTTFPPLEDRLIDVAWDLEDVLARYLAEKNTDIRQPGAASLAFVAEMKKKLEDVVNAITMSNDYSLAKKDMGEVFILLVQAYDMINWKEEKYG